MKVSGYNALKVLICSDNQLISLDLCENDSLEMLYIGNNPLLDTVYLPIPKESVSISDQGSPNIDYLDCGSNTSGITEYNNDDFHLYPKPTKSLLTLENLNSDLITIEITSLNGSLIMGKEMEGTTHQLDLSTFEMGVYFITIRSRDFVTTKKIIKL